MPQHHASLKVGLVTGSRKEECVSWKVHGTLEINLVVSPTPPSMPPVVQLGEWQHIVQTLWYIVCLCVCVSVCAPYVDQPATRRYLAKAVFQAVNLLWILLRHTRKSKVCVVQVS